MQPESKKLLFDMLEAARAVDRFTAGRMEDDLATDLMFRSAVERQFEIIGEAMSRLVKLDLPTAERISEYRKIIGFRNALIHGYDSIDHQITWRIIMSKIPVLIAEVDTLLPKDEFN